jgi:hypothetical protein
MGDDRTGEAKEALVVTRAELREIVSSEIKRARGLKTMAEIKAGWKSRDEMEPGWRDKEKLEVSQQAARTPTLAERLARGLGLLKGKAPDRDKEREPER